MSKIHTTYLTVPRQYRKGVKRDFIRTIRQNLYTDFKEKQTYEDMIIGFKKRYKTNNLHSIYLDGTTNWYLDPLYHCEAELLNLPNTKDTLALDIGCGASPVCYWLRDNDYNWSYIGIDIVKEAKKYVKPLDNASFIAKDIKNLNSSDLPKKPDIIFAVNSLCYFKNLKNNLDNLYNISADKAKLIIIDIPPTILWYNNTYTKARSSVQTHLILKNSGWITKRRFIMSVYNFANMPIMNISYALLCERA